MSLQYLKKEVRDDVDFFHADKHWASEGIKVSYKVMLSLLIGMSKHFQSIQSKKFVCSKLRKWCFDCFCVLLCSIVMQKIWIFYRDPVTFIVTCYFTFQIFYM